jgi:hypothetical protein
MSFLQRWLDVRKVSPSFNDQMGFEYMYNTIDATEKSKITILPPDALNSNAPPMGLQLPHNQILHLAAESGEMRSEVFKLGSKIACDSISSESQVPLQIGLLQEKLRDIGEKM